MMNIVSDELATADDKPTIILRHDLSTIQINIAAIALLELEHVPFRGRHIADILLDTLQSISTIVLETTRNGLPRSNRVVHIFGMPWKMSIHRLNRYWVVRIDDITQSASNIHRFH